MALTLKTVPPARGAHWVRDGVRLFLQRPVAFTAPYALLFAALMLSVLLLQPLTGVLMAGLPLFGLGYMVAAQAALLQGPVTLGAFVEPLRTTAAQRRALLLLCALFAAAMLLAMVLANAVADGGFVRLVEAYTRAEPSPAEVDALLNDRRMAMGVLLLFALITLVSLVFWHAPALVHWGQQGVAQSLFSSALAVWRARGAFVVYGLAWVGLILVVQVVLKLLLAVLGGGAFASMLAFTVNLMLSALFYVSVVFSFNDSFGTS
jgi:hypothetical protein